jgi:hypothetical protein
MNETNNDVPFFAIVAGSSVVQVYDREYNRLQLDLNYAF